MGIARDKESSFLCILEMNIVLYQYADIKRGYI